MIITTTLGATTLGMTLFTYCPPTAEGVDGTSYAVQLENSWAVVRSRTNNAYAQPRVPVGAGGAAGGKGDPAVVGQWSGVIPWDVIAIHAAVLPSGEVLHYSYPDGSSGSRARIWSPLTGAFTPVNWNDDLFCSGLTHLADGRLFVSGGNDTECSFQGTPDTNIFDPVTRTWTALGDMEDGRWYPASVTLGDGSVMIFTGLDRTCETNRVAEMYTPGAGLSVVPEAERHLALYARLHLLSDGRIAHVGPEADAWTLTLGDGWDFVDWNNHGGRWDGTSVLLPGRVDEVMVIGGGGEVDTNTCEVIDFKEASPEFRYVAPMHSPRGHVDALLLPDKTIFVVGGGLNGLYDDPVFVPELYDPDMNTWLELPEHAYGRMYHSTTLLLPDGRVLIAGQDAGESANHGEIYEPRYLFQGPRPSISAAPESLVYGQSFEVSSPEAEEIASAVLIKLSSNTHSVNFGQRLLDVEFAHTGGSTLAMMAPSSPNLAPPGHYMLFILNGNEVPSVSRIIRVGPPGPGDVDGDGDVDFADLLIVLSNWGPCPPVIECPGDVDGDLEVGFPDLLAVLSNWS